MENVIFFFIFRLMTPLFSGSYFSLSLKKLHHGKYPRNAFYQFKDNIIGWYHGSNLLAAARSDSDFRKFHYFEYAFQLIDFKQYASIVYSISSLKPGCPSTFLLFFLTLIAPRRSRWSFNRSLSSRTNGNWQGNQIMLKIVSSRSESIVSPLTSPEFLRRCWNNLMCNNRNELSISRITLLFS